MFFLCFRCQNAKNKKNVQIELPNRVFGHTKINSMLHAVSFTVWEKHRSLHFLVLEESSKGLTCGVNAAPLLFGCESCQTWFCVVEYTQGGRGISQEKRDTHFQSC